MFFIFQLYRRNLDQDHQLFLAKLNYINDLWGISSSICSFSRYRAVYNEFVLATINNAMFETNGILISKCMWSIINCYFLFVS